MSSEDKAIENYNSLRPHHFHHLAGFQLHQTLTAGRWDLSLKIELQDFERTDPGKLVLSFGGVSELKFVPAKGVIRLSCLEVVSIQNGQCEGCHYHVHAGEEDVSLSFYCRDFTATIDPV